MDEKLKLSDIFAVSINRMKRYSFATHWGRFLLRRFAAISKNEYFCHRTFSTPLRQKY